MEISEQKREKTIIRTSILGIIGNVLLVAIKAFVGILANSISVIMDAVNNLTDALSSVITIVGTKLSNKKPDRKHPFGHGRVEYIASVLVALLILVAGGIAIYESIMSIVNYFQTKETPKFELYSLIIIGVAIAIKLGIAILYKIQGKKVQSGTLLASGTDALFDAILSTATLVGAIFAYTLGWYVEGYLGIIIGIFILKSGIEILIQSFSLIIGERHDKEEIIAIQKDILAVPGVLGAYDLIINNYGHNKNIGSVHIGVKGSLKAYEIQTIERNITAIMYQKYNIIMTVGIYAEVDDSPELIKMRNTVGQIIKKYPNIIQIHGFYVDFAAEVCNFDLVFSFEEKEPEARVNEINKELKEKYSNFVFIIQIDKDYSLS